MGGKGMSVHAKNDSNVFKIVSYNIENILDENLAQSLAMLAPPSDTN